MSTSKRTTVPKILYQDLLTNYNELVDEYKDQNKEYKDILDRCFELKDIRSKIEGLNFTRFGLKAKNKSLLKKYDDLDKANYNTVQLLIQMEMENLELKSQIE